MGRPGDSADTRGRAGAPLPPPPSPSLAHVPLLAGNARLKRPPRSTSPGPSSPSRRSGNHLRIGTMEHRLARQPFIILCHPPRFLLGKITAGHCGITSISPASSSRRLLAGTASTSSASPGITQTPSLPSGCCLFLLFFFTLRFSGLSSLIGKEKFPGE